MNRFFSARLGDLSAARGEKFVTSLVGGFSCPKNIDVENFLHNGAVVSAQMGSSITHLVFDQSDASCVGYFTLTHKPIVLPASVLSLALQKKMKRFADLDGGAFLVSAFLIAQLAKNYAVEDGKLISGRDLVGFILEQIRGIRDTVGGKVVFLEYEKDRPKLKEFYKSCAFEEFKMPSDANDSEKLGQLFCFLNDKPPTGGLGS